MISRFTLRTLLVAVSVFGVFFAWLGVKVHQGSRQLKAVASILKANGTVFYDYQYKQSGARGGGVDAQATSSVPEFIRSFFGDDMFSKVTYVQLDDDLATNDDLRCLEALPHLKTLFLSSEKFSADGLSVLSALPELEDLSIGIQMDDADLDHLAQLRSLKELYLMGPQPDGYILRWHSRSRRVVDVPGYQSLTTSAGIERLSTQLPSCRISY